VQLHIDDVFEPIRSSELNTALSLGDINAIIQAVLEQTGLDKSATS
jgi:hypothetical protein